MISSEQHVRLECATQSDAIVSKIEIFRCFKAASIDELVCRLCVRQAPVTRKDRHSCPGYRDIRGPLNLHRRASFTDVRAEAQSRELNGCVDAIV